MLFFLPCVQSLRLKLLQISLVIFPLKVWSATFHPPPCRDESVSVVYQTSKNSSVVLGIKYTCTLSFKDTGLAY